MLRTSDLVVIAVLVLAGAYMLLVHEDPLPLNHEAVGMGEDHLVHGFVGLILLVGAAYWWRRTRAAPA